MKRCPHCDHMSVTMELGRCARCGYLTSTYIFSLAATRLAEQGCAERIGDKWLAVLSDADMALLTAHDDD